MKKPTYRVLNKHLTIMGIDRQLMILAIFIGGGFVMALGSIITGLVVFGVFAGLGWMKAQDPIGMQLAMSRPPAHFDPALKQPFVLIHAGRKQNEIN